jgi:hypothetical protein
MGALSVVGPAVRMTKDKISNTAKVRGHLNCLP